MKANLKMSKIHKKRTNLTVEEAKKLGLDFGVVYENKCMLCGKMLTSKNEERLAKRLIQHVDEKCEVAKWMRRTSKILEIAGLKNVVHADLIYLQDGKFPEGYERTKPEELEILDGVKNFLDSWGKGE